MIKLNFPCLLLLQSTSLSALHSLVVVRIGAGQGLLEFVGCGVICRNSFSAWVEIDHEKRGRWHEETASVAGMGRSNNSVCKAMSSDFCKLAGDELKYHCEQASTTQDAEDKTVRPEQQRVVIASTAITRVSHLFVESLTRQRLAPLSSST